MLKTLPLLLTLTFATPAWAGLDYYKEGAICDKKAGFCADQMGVSLALTKMYLGDKAEQKLMATIKEVGSEYFNPTSFTMSGGLTCDTKVKQCWTSKLQDKPHEKATKTLFGK
jgi:hypothetical protein